MPRLNGTGPNAQGPMTGRGMGYCNKTASAAPVYGRGQGIGRGRSCGRGFGLRGNYGAGFCAAPEITPEQQKDILKQQKTFLENELKSIDEQIEKL